MTLFFLFWAVVLCLQLANGVKESVWGEEGGRTMLPCHLSPQKVQSSLRQLHQGLTVLWMRHGGSRAPRKRHLVLKVEPTGLKSLGRSMMPRATLWDTGFLQGNFSLQIEPLLKEDAGTYEALVRYGHHVWHCQLDLGVVSVTANLSRPLIESEPIKLNCNSTHPGSPMHTLWFHRDVLIHTSCRLHPLDQSLLISRSMRSDTGPWVCKLTFADGERITARYNLQVIGFAEKTTLVIYTAAGSDAHLPCVLNDNPLDHGISRMAVHWKDTTGRELKLNPTPSRENRPDFTLHLPAVRLDDAGQYSCELTIQNITITETVTLAVMAVTPSIAAPRIAEGSHLLLTCDLSYLKGTEHFQWRWLDLGFPNSSRPVAFSRSLEVLKWGPTLEFTQVTPKDAGIWECSVLGPEGMLGSVQYHLDIAANDQLASLQLLPTEIIFSLFLLLLIVVLSVIALIHRRQRMHSLNFKALDRIVDALPRKGEKNEGQQKFLQLEY